MGIGILLNNYIDNGTNYLVYLNDHVDLLVNTGYGARGTWVTSGT